MSKISKINKNRIVKSAKQKAVKNIVKKQSVKPSSLERNPKLDYVDFSREEDGIIILRNSKNKIIKIIDLIFPR